MECAWQVELDPFCRKVLTKHWPNVPKFEDVREVGKHNLEQVDLIVGGFPCQDISAANNSRVGISGERSGLWSDFYRIICELRPRYVLVENVAALLERDIGKVLGDLADGGFNAEWEVLPAGAFGANHLRKRVFVVAYPCGERMEGQRESTNARILRGGLGACSQEVVQNRVEAWIVDRFRAGEGKPLLRGGDYGLPDWMDRVKSLGNAVVPQIAQWLGERILEADEP